MSPNGRPDRRPPSPECGPLGPDGQRNDARPAPEGGLQEAGRLAAAGRTAIGRTMAQRLKEVLDEPLPEELAALIERLKASEAAQR
jgi:hypothetical protein